MQIQYNKMPFLYYSSYLLLLLLFKKGGGMDMRTNEPDCMSSCNINPEALLLTDGNTLYFWTMFVTKYTFFHICLCSEFSISAQSKLWHELYKNETGAQKKT